jgi:hypothetical protein
MAVWMFAEVAAVMAVELENAAIFGLTGEPLVVTVPQGEPESASVPTASPNFAQLLSVEVAGPGVKNTFASGSV